MVVRLSRSFTFEAAHRLPTFPPGHKCCRLHGHSYRLEVVVEGRIEPAKGYLIDYGQIKAAADPLLTRVDHQCLNDIEGLENPTAENLAKWFYDRLRPMLPLLAAVTVWETPASACEYRGQE
jgi:6-pyruvoyltetrahydropterin/6-carboxytetrahydropterin synthase